MFVPFTAALTRLKNTTYVDQIQVQVDTADNVSQVTERTREIGIRMSIGARRSDIRNQFLIEALVLSLGGGGIGMTLGLLLGFAITHAFGLPFVITPSSILMPFMVSASIGVIFGLYPAVRASRLDPIVALRTE